jgi:nucleoid-associated protein YgaU
LQKVEGSVIIRKGDNLWTISKRTYGQGTRYTTIYLANRDQIRNPDLILPGQVFVMPQQPLGDDEVQRRLQDSAN